MDFGKCPSNRYPSIDAWIIAAAERGDETGNCNMLIIDQITLPPNIPGSLDLNVPWAGLPHCHPAAHYIWWSATGRCCWLSSSTIPTPATATDRSETTITTFFPWRQQQPTDIPASMHGLLRRRKDKIVEIKTHFCQV